MKGFVFLFMICRSDLAVELMEVAAEPLEKYIEKEEFKTGNIFVSRISIPNNKASEIIGKPIGTYITIDVPSLSDMSDELESQLDTIKSEINNLLPNEGLILVAGLGNFEITPDALGPKTATDILATRHLHSEMLRSAGLDSLRPVAVISPNVLGKTGIETAELIKSIVDNIKPVAVIAIDALASRSLSRLGRTVQITNSGISPGSGVGNRRLELNKNFLGVPVISIGVPTVVDGLTLAADIASKSALNEDEVEKLKTTVEPGGSMMMVTPREIDILIDKASHLLSLSINSSLQPSLSTEDIEALVY